MENRIIQNLLYTEPKSVYTVGLKIFQKSRSRKTREFKYIVNQFDGKGIYILFQKIMSYCGLNNKNVHDNIK